MNDFDDDCGHHPEWFDNKGRCHHPNHPSPTPNADESGARA